MLNKPNYNATNKNYLIFKKFISKQKLKNTTSITKENKLQEVNIVKFIRPFFPYILVDDFS